MYLNRFSDDKADKVILEIVKKQIRC